MADKARLIVDLFDAYGDRPDDLTTIRLVNRRLGRSSVFRDLKTLRGIRLEGIESFPHGLYQVVVDPASYMPVGRFVNIPPSNEIRISIHCAIDPDRVVAVDFADFAELPDPAQDLLKESNRVLGFEGKSGQDLYQALDNIRRAGFLNIVTKAGSTPLTDGRSVLSHIERLMELRGDRFFAVVPHLLREEVKNSIGSGLFHPVSEALHHPPEGFGEAGSFKTDDNYGNLQLTFFVRGNDWVADIDIDDAAGLLHVFQVVRHWLSGRPTHPYNIHEILIFHQRLDPLYRFRLS